MITNALSPRLVAERNARMDALGPRPPRWRPIARRRWRRQYAAIAAMDVSAAAEMLRSVYSNERVRALAERPSPTFAMLRRAVPDPVEPERTTRHAAIMPTVEPDEERRR
jgi:hypothetical protein